MERISTLSARARGAALSLCVCGIAISAAWADEPPRGIPIGSITIQSHNVFDTHVPPTDHRFYRIANGLHRNTREAVIQRELLFTVGDPYDPALVQETERNLRRLPFIRHADCTAAPDSTGKVAVVVHTYDAWTLEVVSNFKRAGGRANWKAGLADHNILGEGKGLSAIYSRGDTASAVALEWQDPYFLGRKLKYTISAAGGSAGRRVAAGVSRPFYASIVRSSMGFTGSYAQSNVATFADGRAVGTVRKRTQEFSFEYGIALGTSTARNRHVAAGFLHHQAAFAAIPGTPAGPMPFAEQLEFFRIGAEWEVLDFIKARQVRKFSHVEDINLGFGMFPSVSWAPRLRAQAATQSQFLPSLVLRKGFRWTSSQILLLRGSYASTYSDGGNSNRIASMDAAYFVRGLPRQTLAFHVAYDHGRRLDPAVPLELGEKNGLRGYGRNQFTGDERLLLNVEDRVFIRDEVSGLFDVGLVAFYDTGYAWPAGDPVRLADLRSSAGLGLRVAPSRSNSNSPVRIDLAYAFRDNRSRSRWSLSVLGGLGFGGGAN